MRVKCWTFQTVRGIVVSQCSERFDKEKEDCMNQSNQIRKTALYCRLSQDDGIEGDSNSIQNQELICKGGFSHLIHMTAAHLW